MDDQFAARLPKAELHIHIEGSLEPELMFSIAERNGVRLPFKSIAELRGAYNFGSLQSFLDIYYQGMNVLREERDFYELTRAYLLRANADAVRHAEIFFDPQAHTSRDVPMETVVSGITRALHEGQSQFGITSMLILCFLRHLPEESALATLEEALPFLDLIGGVGLDSSEVGHPPRDFVQVFERARQNGLHCVAHAGEEGPPDYVYQALDLLHVERIDHGVRCEEDPELVARLARESIALTVCPLSNVKLGVFASLEAHNLKKLLNSKVRVTINSDDPAYFGGYIGDNYAAARKALDLSTEDLVTLARNSFLASFLSQEAREQRLAEIDRYVASST